MTGLQGGVVYDYTNGINNTVLNAWVQLFKFEVRSWIAGKLSLDIDGTSADTANTGANRKGVTLRQERAFDVATNGIVTISTVGTDFAGGAGAANVEVRYVVTATGSQTGWVSVQVRTIDATNDVLWGMARLRVNGKLQSFYLGID